MENQVEVLQNQVEVLQNFTNEKKEELKTFTKETIEMLKAKIGIKKKEMIEMKHELEEKQKNFSGSLQNIAEDQKDKYKSEIEKINQEQLENYKKTLEDVNKKNLNEYENDIKKMTQNYLNNLQQQLIALGLDENLINYNMYEKMQERIDEAKKEIKKLKEKNILGNPDKMREIFNELITDQEEKKLAKNMKFIVNHNGEEITVDLSNSVGIDNFIKILVEKICKFKNKYPSELNGIFGADSTPQEVIDGIEIISGKFS